MGNVTNTIGFQRGSYGPPESTGTGKKVIKVIATVNLSASYATGGDTLLVPTGLGSLVGVNVMPVMKSATDKVDWDGSLSTPKLKVYVDGAEVEATAASDQSAKFRQVELTFLQ